MYPNPERIRDRKVNVRLDTPEYRLLSALADYRGEQLSTMIRRMALAQAMSDLSFEPNPMDCATSDTPAKRTA